MKKLINSVLALFGFQATTERAIWGITAAINQLDVVMERELANQRRHLDAEREHKESAGVALREAQRAARISKKLEDLIGGDA
jgi:hypothetical protein